MTDGPWPTPDQELLHRAALLRDSRGLAAWQRWKGARDLFGVYADASDRLLPMVYRNLRDLGADEPAMRTLGGVHRYWWTSNQGLLRRIAAVLERLHAEGIRTMVLDGVAAAILYYEHLGVRPIDVVHVMTPVDQAPTAVQTLQREGWRGTTGRVAEALRYRPSARLVGESGQPLELHGYALRGRLDPSVDRALWQRSVPLLVHKAVTASLAPGDALLCAVMQGMRGSSAPAVGWIADAMAILSATEHPIDWEALLEEARARRVELELGRGLDYLASAFDVAMPGHVMTRLRSAAPSRLQRLEHRYLAPRPGRRRLLSRVTAFALEYLQLVEGRSLHAQLGSLPGFLRFRLRGRAGLRRVARCPGRLSSPHGASRAPGTPG